MNNIIHKAETRGVSKYSWLDSRHNFSFAGYTDRNRVHFGALRVLNDDIVQPGTGFGKHPHDNMEIISIPLKGALMHKDSMDHEQVIGEHEVQVMSAGTGIHHSEFNRESEDTTLYQIWIEPREVGIEPRWEAARFADRKAEGDLPLLVSGRTEDQSKGALYIHQDASISGGLVEAGKEINQPIRDQAYLLVSDGEIEIGDERLRRGDSAEITQVDSVSFTALSDAEVILIDVPA